ncbi:hypothetical protein [Nitrosomonas sp.]|uniref:hypothetical protein n=1 Tax=Nitrosomonas sp. TaxID=42353 RepID=UPI0025CD175E|nr:hypothetical protein [Nitrosomonas sp.]
MSVATLDRLPLPVNTVLHEGLGCCGLVTGLVGVFECALEVVESSSGSILLAR